MLFAEPRRSVRLLVGALLPLLSCPFASSVAEAGPRPLWSFHAGAPLSGPPGFGTDGTVAIGTVDGYVHALRSDGVFRYSYTVDGRVVASPVVLADGLVLVASDESRLYAIRPDGSLAWETTVFGGVLSPLAVDAQERVWLRTGSGTAIAMSRRGGVVGFAKIGRAMTLGPTVLARGVLVGSPAGELGLIGDFGRFQRLSVVRRVTIFPGNRSDSSTSPAHFRRRTDARLASVSAGRPRRHRFAVACASGSLAKDSYSSPRSGLESPGQSQCTEGFSNSISRFSRTGS